MGFCQFKVICCALFFSFLIEIGPFNHSPKKKKNSFEEINGQSIIQFIVSHIERRLLFKHKRIF